MQRVKLLRGSSKQIKDPRAVSWGRLGGVARAASLGTRRRKAIAEAAAGGRWWGTGKSLLPEELQAIEMVLAWGATAQKARLCRRWGRDLIVGHVRRRHGAFLRSRDQVLEWVSLVTMYRWEKRYPELRKKWSS